MRGCGILLAISSLPSKYGIGCFSKEAYQFVDWLKEAGQKYWQILPLGPTGYGNSPYQSFSTFAGNPYFIDLETLIEEGYLTKEECASLEYVEEERYVDYGWIYHNRFHILSKAFERFYQKEEDGFLEFCKEQASWLEDYSLFMAIKEKVNSSSYCDWEEPIRQRKEEVVKEYQITYAKEITFYKFLQYKFFQQWKRLKSYANEAGIRIIGDLPLYVACDSADTWANKELFRLDENRLPKVVAGCPPDAFSQTGQLWGNPVYDWEYHKQTSYAWWIKRMQHAYLLYDVVRLDHFRGFDEYYVIPYEHTTAEYGWWEKGPGITFFEHIEKALGKIEIIAEDLGFLTDSVRELVHNTGYPGMKVLEFAFDSREESDYLPHNYNRNCVVYTGTHDNDTMLGWYDTAKKEDLEFALDYMDVLEVRRERIVWSFVRLAMSSVANLCMIPMQDYLQLGSEARMNIPATVGTNWSWRMKREELSTSLAQKIYHITKLYVRC